MYIANYLVSIRYEIHWFNDRNNKIPLQLGGKLRKYARYPNPDIMYQIKPETQKIKFVLFEIEI